MKKSHLFIFVFILLLSANSIFAQLSNPHFAGANPTLRHYKSLYVLNSEDQRKIMGVLGNMKNAINDPRLKGKLSLELIVSGAGVKVYEKDGPFEKALKSLKARGVILAECENTILKRHINKKTLFPFISYVPSATGEIIIRGSEGWVILYP